MADNPDKHEGCKGWSGFQMGCAFEGEGGDCARRQEVGGPGPQERRMWRFTFVRLLEWAKFVDENSENLGYVL